MLAIAAVSLHQAWFDTSSLNPCGKGSIPKEAVQEVRRLGSIAADVSPVPSIATAGTGSKS